MDLRHIPVVDAHAYPIWQPESVDSMPDTATFARASTRGYSSDHTLTRLFYQRSLQDIAALLDCEPTAEAIATQRGSLEPSEIVQVYFEAANIGALLLDDALEGNSHPDAELYPQLLPWEYHRHWVSTHRLICLEPLAEQLISKVDRFDVFLEWFRSELDPIPSGVVGLKSAAARRFGLDIHLVYPEVAEDCFYMLKRQQIEAGIAPRLQKELADFLLLIGLGVATRYHVPLQFEAGFGCSLADLRLANPLHLRPILEEPQYREAPIVILQGAYPFTREAGILAARYPQAFVDIGSAIPELSTRGMLNQLHQLLECAPVSKIMYSSGGRLLPELFYLGAKWGRAIISQALDEVVQDGDLTAQDAERGAIAILNGNARTLYALNDS